jgi:hypothetical protein
LKILQRYVPGIQNSLSKPTRQKVTFVNHRQNGGVLCIASNLFLKQRVSNKLSAGLRMHSADPEFTGHLDAASFLDLRFDAVQIIPSE